MSERCHTILLPRPGDLNMWGALGDEMRRQILSYNRLVGDIPPHPSMKLGDIVNRHLICSALERVLNHSDWS
jgi:hypothetical protein